MTKVFIVVKVIDDWGRVCPIDDKAFSSLESAHDHKLDLLSEADENDTDLGKLDIKSFEVN